MSKQDFNKIRRAAENHTIEPRTQVWEKLESKLKHKRTQGKMLTYRNVAVAAILVSILSVTAVFNVSDNNHDPQKFVTNEDYKPIIIENLEISNKSAIYCATNIQQLKIAYQSSEKRDILLNW